MTHSSDTVLAALNLTSELAGAYGQDAYTSKGPLLRSVSPIDGRSLGVIRVAGELEYERVITDAEQCFREWRQVPAPVRGQLVREIAELIREHKHSLGALIAWETGKLLREGDGEIQEVIDIADFAVGLSRQLYGKSMHSERPRHDMREQWHPLGLVGVITAFNYPCAVWGWNAMIAAVCGDVLVWKPSELAPLSSLALNNLCRRIAARHGYPALFSLVQGDSPALGERIAADRRIPLVSATGSCRMGRSVASVVGARLGRTLLELGGNNAVTVLKDADLKLAVSSTVFGAMGTAGQRCTTTRRVLLESPIAERFTQALLSAVRSLKIGNPLDPDTMVGPLISAKAVDVYREAIAQIRAQGGEILSGDEVLQGMPSGHFVRPTVVRAHRGMKIAEEETFAPIVYLYEVSGLDQAIELNNAVSQGLSSAIFTRDLSAAERFISATGSDCGIANVNTGTSQAEVGGAFGGEKDTGGGRESGSDSWQQYMRRQTTTINYGTELLLAQGLTFDVDG